jgi:hypothetical protein
MRRPHALFLPTVLVASLTLPADAVRGEARTPTAPLRERLAHDRAAPLADARAIAPADGAAAPGPFARPGADAGGGGMSPVRAFLASALVPGLGQLLQGSRWGYANLALEATGWIGYVHYKQEGLDGEDAYAAYAATHYDRDRYQAVVDDIYAEWNAGACDPPGTGPREPCQDLDSYFTLDELDDGVLTDHAVEDIGKLDKYIFGWLDWADGDGDHLSDYDPAAHDFSGWEGPGDEWPAGFPAFTSEYRAVYQDLRRAANADHDRAARFSWLLVLNRVVSAFHAAWLAREGDAGGGAEHPRLRVDPDPDAGGVRVAWAGGF